ncbi:hypothetical protein DMB38_07845 [Streptomyces sp. WAC 06738]|uniref:hypothetical protein n=1 Tax=Streptomyces sp. WAC 06738 TaxID=2203210 RepID=UPI000F6F9CC2|nr:hypothetical protein [Streptomyces sp. WAC 06738]AZM45754.1 hypothetical protein DMB38_07845 [Streptomyces sp. WAC 06738]
MWERALPGDHLEDRRKKFMRWDYGLVEVFFARVDRQWSGSGFTIQVHRLAEAGGGPVPACLRDAYGDFRSSVPLGELTDSLAAAGLSLTEVESYSDREFSQFTSPSGRVAVYVLTDPRPDADYRIPRGGSGRSRWRPRRRERSAGGECRQVDLIRSHWSTPCLGADQGD